MDTVSAGTATCAVLSGLADDLTARLASAVRDEDDAVHQARITVRRLRSVLQVYRPVLHRRAARDLRRRLKNLGAALGEVRDLEVMALKAGEKLGPEARSTVRKALADEYDAEYRRAQHELRRIIRDKEVARLQKDLASFTAHPRRKDLAKQAAAVVFPSLVERAIDEVETATQGEWSAPGGVEREEAFHTTRKAGRRLRYAAEAAIDLVSATESARLADVAAAGESIQDLLGEHRDEVLFAKRLEERADRSDDEDAAEYRALAAAARARGEAVLTDVSTAMERLSALRRGHTVPEVE